MVYIEAMSEPVVIARAGVKRLQELQKVLKARSIQSDIVCPPGANTNT